MGNIEDKISNPVFTLVTFGVIHKITTFTRWGRQRRNLSTCYDCDISLASLTFMSDFIYTR